MQNHLLFLGNLY